MTTMTTMTTTDELEASTTDAMPVTFVAHGAPPLLEEPAWMAELAGWGAAMPKPKALLVVSAHWEARPATLGATSPLPLVYDFYGFPEHFYRLTYPSPGAPALAARGEALLAGAGLPSARDERRVSTTASTSRCCACIRRRTCLCCSLLPSLAPQELFALGRALAPLREKECRSWGAGF
jgi:4,5-DOPA dioxygenase extradiol